APSRDRGPERLTRPPIGWGTGFRTSGHKAAKEIRATGQVTCRPSKLSVSFKSSNRAIEATARRVGIHGIAVTCYRAGLGKIRLVRRGPGFRPRHPASLDE